MGLSSPRPISGTGDGWPAEALGAWPIVAWPKGNGRGALPVWSNRHRSEHRDPGRRCQRPHPSVVLPPPNRPGREGVGGHRRPGGGQHPPAPIVCPPKDKTTGPSPALVLPSAGGYSRRLLPALIHLGEEDLYSSPQDVPAGPRLQEVLDPLLLC